MMSNYCDWFYWLIYWLIALRSDQLSGVMPFRERMGGRTRFWQHRPSDPPPSSHCGPASVKRGSGVWHHSGTAVCDYCESVHTCSKFWYFLLCRFPTCAAIIQTALSIRRAICVFFKIKVVKHTPSVHVLVCCVWLTRSFEAKFCVTKWVSHVDEYGC